MDRNHFTPFIVDDPGPRQKPPRDNRCLMLQIATAFCAVSWTLGIILVVMMINGNWHAASSMQSPAQIEAAR